jgi:hypothetical protein
MARRWAGERRGVKGGVTVLGPLRRGGDAIAIDEGPGGSAPSGRARSTVASLFLPAKSSFGVQV